MASLLWALALAAACIGVFIWAFRSVRKANRTAPPAAMRNARERRLNVASGFLLLPLIAYAAVLDQAHAPLMVGAGGTFIILMLLLRLARIPWQWRLALIPFVAIAAALAGAFSATLPNASFNLESLESWTVLGVTLLVVALSSLLSIFSFPVGFGERAH